MPKTDFLVVLRCCCIKFKVLGPRGAGASASTVQVLELVLCWCCAKLMAYGRFGGAPKFWHRQVERKLSWGDGRQTSLVVRPQKINEGVWVIWKREGSRFRMPNVPPPRDLAGCRNGKTRPAKGGEERGMMAEGRYGWLWMERGRGGGMGCRCERQVLPE